MTTIPGPNGRAVLAANRGLLNASTDTIEALTAQCGRTLAVHVGPTSVVVAGDRAPLPLRAHLLTAC